MKQFVLIFATLLWCALLPEHTAKVFAQTEGVAVVLTTDNTSPLAERIQIAHQGDLGQITRLEVHAGTLTAADCQFIRTALPALRVLKVEGTADFAGSTIPKGAFAGFTSLQEVRATRVQRIGSKAFSLCEGLRKVDFPNVRAVEVQAFAQAKGSSAGQLRVARFGALEDMAPRTFYYCTNLRELYLNKPPKPQRPVGKEGLWFERVTEMVIHVPSRAVYDQFMALENCTDIDWSAFNFVADNGDRLPKIEAAPAYEDQAYDHLRSELLPCFDRTEKDFAGDYYTGDFKLSLNLYTFNMNLNAWVNDTESAPKLSTTDAIRWAAENGFDAVDITCYYIPGYSNTAMPTKPEAEIMDYARRIKALCKKLGIEISGTGLQNNFADPNAKRRETDVERIKFWIKVAAEMGAPVIRIFAGPPPSDIRREGWEKIARERMVPHIQAVADFAREHYPSVRIGLQNHGGMLSTANQVMQVLKWIDRENVGIINDTGFYRDFLSTNATQYDWYRDIALILPYSNNFQIKKKPAGAETRGLMDLERLLRDIRKSPYRGYLPIELLWVSKDVGYPGKMEVPPYEETLQFLQRLKEAIEKTRIPETTQNTRHEEVPGISGSTLHLLEHTTPTQLCSLACLPSQAHIEVKSALGVPREALEPLEEGDRVTITSDHETRQYSVAIHRHEWVNLALINDPSRIKRSSFRGNAPVTNAFNGQAVSTSGNGHTVDASQASTAGKEQFWLAADLGAEQEIDAFGVAWGTSVGQLKKRLKGGLYRVAYTNAPAKWEALSDARQSGRRGLAGYAAPKGWEIAYSQNVSLLPDANGNKFFFQALDKPIHARYIMVTGELAAQTIEIYNFFAFDQRLAPGATRTVQLQRHDWATIRPDSPKMTLAPGRPALVERGARIPAFVVLPHRNLQLTATLLNPQGKALYRLDTTPLTIGKPFRIEPHITASQLGTYTLQIEMQDQQLRYDAYTFTVIDEPVERYTFEHPYPAFQATKGKLNYTPDYRGNRLIDYSHAGYKGGGVAMRTPPTKIILEPSTDSTGDDTERIQRAIDLIGRATPNAAGFRGTLLLKAGTYRISRPIYIAHSGIVIRGEGDGHNTIPTHDQPLSPDNWFDYTHSELPEKGVTKLVATWVADSYNKQIALFNIGGNRATEIGTAVAITDQYVPVGAQQLHVADASTFKAGDVVRITRAVNATWAHDLAMDRITDAPGVLSENQWATKERLERAYTGITQERTIASVDTKNNLLHLVEPIVDPLNSKYGTSTVATIDTTPRVAQVGIENLQLISRFNSKSRASNSAFDQTYAYYDDEQHAQVGIRLVHAEDSWVRRVTSWHLDIAVAIGSEVSRITLQDINCLEPVSGTGGERRYSFTNAGGQQVLTQRCYTRYTRHGFIVMGHVMGPNVFLDCRSDYQFDANEPHLRWSAGGLYDNVRGRIYLQNRWNNGTAHGWSGANYTLYNCDGKFIISQNPLAANYLFGRLNEADRLPFVMEEVDPGNVPNFRAHEQSLGKEMQPRSLYLAQLHDRAGSKAVVVASSCALPNPKDESKGFVEQFATLQTILLDGKPLPDFEHDCFEYHFPVALDATSLPRIEAVAAKGITIHREESEQAICFMTSKPKGLSTRYTIIPDRISKEPLSGSGSAKQLANLIDNNPTTSWSSPGTPYVQFYLGEQPIEIESVSLGYCRNTQSRRQYYFDFEVSDDGYNWHTISASEWQKDNLGKGHVMGMQLMPGVGNNPSDYETFRFPAGTQGRLLRIRMYGARFGRGSGTTNANAYWAIDVKTKQ